VPPKTSSVERLDKQTFLFNIREGAMRRRLGLAMALVLVMAMVLPACTEPAGDKQDGKSYKVAFIYADAPGDLGWTYEHERGRNMLEEEFGDQIIITYAENIADGPEAARVMRRYAQEGYDLIFATSSGYIDYVYQVAEEFPEIKFAHCSGNRTRHNMTTYFGRMYQPRYLSGIVAGKMTMTGNIGYVAAFPTPEVVRGINAFTLGVRSVNPEARVTVRWTDTWDSPAKEREAAVALVDAGADIIAQHQDSTEPQKVAQERGVLSIGYNSDMRPFVGDTVLTGPVWNWGPYYIETVQEAMDGAWVSRQYWEGLESDVVRLADFSAKVPPDVRTLVEAARTQIIRNDRIFCGPIRDQAGNQLVGTGACLSDADKLTMQFFVEGVVGTIPNN